MININCDVGEGMNNEALLFKYITSCSIACGGHTGDEKSMREILSLAQSMGVKVGAHPSYPDRANFGRKSMDISNEDLIKSVQQQIDSLNSIAETLNIHLDHIKAHGALYNDAAKDETVANTFLDAIEKYQLPIYAPYKSVLAQQATKRGIAVVLEAFADRNYNEDHSLVSRSSENALITNPWDMLKHVDLIKEGVIKTPKNEIIETKADTFCIHSDTTDATKMVKYLHRDHKVKFKKYGDKGVLVEWPQLLDHQNLKELKSFREVLQSNGIHDVIQGVASVLILDPPKDINLTSIYLDLPEADLNSHHQFIIPVCYDAQFAPDLDYLSDTLQLNREEIISIHSEGLYRVFAIGFLPGFMYLGGLDERLHAVRKAEPRLHIPKGSVGIGGAQTGIYPQVSPGGWQLIGKTPLELFNPRSDPPCFAKAGDTIKFQSINIDEFKTIQSAVEAGIYVVRKEVIND